MPIFEYVCKSCNHRFEYLVMGPRKPRCPACASIRLERQVEAFAQGRASRQPRSINSDSVISHARALLGNIPTIPRYKTKGMGSPGRHSPRSIVG
jgi:putative FmdB family regulatory protein